MYMKTFMMYLLILPKRYAHGISQENICSRVPFLINLLSNNLLLKNRLWHSCFAVNFATFLRTPFFTEHLK